MNNYSFAVTTLEAAARRELLLGNKAEVKSCEAALALIKLHTTFPTEDNKNAAASPQASP